MPVWPVMAIDASWLGDDPKSSVAVPVAAIRG